VCMMGWLILPGGTTTSQTLPPDAPECYRVLFEARERLDPATVTVLEQSLATIDEAIADAYGALRTDPADGYLTAHLATIMKRKITVLQRAAALANAAS